MARIVPGKAEVQAFWSTTELGGASSMSILGRQAHPKNQGDVDYRIQRDAGGEACRNAQGSHSRRGQRCGAECSK